MRSALDLQRMAVIDAAAVVVSCLDLAAALSMSPIPVVNDASGASIAHQHMAHAMLNARRQLASSVVMSSMFASTGRAGLQLLGYQAQSWVAPALPAASAWRLVADATKIPSLQGEQSVWGQRLKAALKPWHAVSLTPDAVLAAI